MQALDGAIGNALDIVEKALRAVPEEFSVRPETYWVRGELWAPGGGDKELAESNFRQAIELACATSARAWELRSKTSLAGPMRETGRRDAARTMLAEIYDWFTEGFDTADLKDAGALLEELSISP